MRYFVSKKVSRLALFLAGILFLLATALLFPQTALEAKASAGGSDDTIVLRVCNWEEYIDLGDWDDEEVIDLDEVSILGVNALYEDFEDWYYEKYGKKVVVEYSCFGTNEELYNMLTIGDEYDLVCPSDYLIMKLMAEEWLAPFSDSFYDENDEDNYYIRGVAPFIREAFEKNSINGQAWSEYAAGYMWGVTGFLYNPDEVDVEDVSTWKILNNPDYYRQITVKDNVRDTMFAAVGAIKSDLLLSEEFVNDPAYSINLMKEMNDVSVDNIEAVQDYLQITRENAYSFESDSGKADMITGKVLVNLQWSGDAVYAMDQAEEDDYYLEYAVPDECTDLWFDGWVMLKSGIGGNPEKQHAAEAFINFLSMPENAIRNMYYIGYTSTISGGDYSDLVYQYLQWNYSAEEDEEDVVEYNVGMYFSGDSEDEYYTMTVPEDQLRRQLFAQYPPKEVIDRSAIMWYFEPESGARVNQMWINVRCLNVKQIPVWAWIVGVLVAGGFLFVIIRNKVKNRKIRK